MKALRFDIYAKQGVLTNPLTNRGISLTFTNLHSLSLKGILGASLGFSGKVTLFNKQRLLEEEWGNSKRDYPDDIELRVPENLLELEGLKYSVVTDLTAGKFKKLTQVRNNSSGTSVIGGGDGNPKPATTVQYEFQILENIHYSVYIYEDSPHYTRIKEHLLNDLYAYTPYLGKREYPIDIQNVEEVVVEKFEITEPVTILSVLEKGKTKLYTEETMFGTVNPRYFSETIPHGYRESTLTYTYLDVINTDSKVEAYKGNLYREVDGNNILSVLEG